jgi:hypothetical protein
MRRDEFKREAESLTDKALLAVVSLPAPWSAVAVLAWAAAIFFGGVWLGAWIG